MTDEPDDAELWRAVVSGDSRAFGVLFDRHRDRLFRSALRSATSAADAEDIVAMTYLELWRRRTDVRLVNGSVLPWLLVTQQNVFRNLRRHQRRHRSFLARLPADDDARSAEDLTVEQADAFERSQEASALLERLAKPDAEILTLVLLEELSLAEASVVLGISTDAAKQRLSRARRRARALAQFPMDPTGGLEAAEGGRLS